MKNAFIFLISICWLCASQAQTVVGPQDKIIPAKKTYKIRTKKSIKLTTRDSISPDYEEVRSSGKSLVFEYEFRAAQNEGIADDEYLERILFEATPKNGRFNYSFTSFKKSKAIFRMSCFCPEAGTYLIQRGRIKGRMLNSRTWDVTIEIRYYPRNNYGSGPVTKKIRGKFKINNS